MVDDEPGLTCKGGCLRTVAHPEASQQRCGESLGGALRDVHLGRDVLE
jgi:hypothetical protein